MEHSGPDKRKKEKDWMILLNSIHDVQLNPSKTENKDEVYHWPQPWIAPDGWEKIQLATSSSFPLGRAGGVKVKPSRVEKSSAFERYELSNHILDILRNPHKKDSLDMDDPLVRVVRETLLADTSEKDKPLCTASENKATITNENVDKVLPEKDFVAFNPMVTHIFGSWTAQKKTGNFYFVGLQQETWQEKERFSTSKCASQSGRNYNRGFRR